MSIETTLRRQSAWPLVLGLLVLASCGSDGRKNEGGAGAAAGSAGIGGGGLPGAGGTGVSGSGPASGGAGDGGNVGTGGRVDGGGSGAGSTGGAGGAGAPPLVPGSTMDCTTPLAGGPAVRRIEAECAFGPAIGGCQGARGGQQGVELENGDASVGFIEGGDALWYENVLFDGVDTLTVRYAKGVAGGELEVRIDEPSGALLGVLTPAETGDWAAWREQSVALTPASGTHTLYLVATGSAAGILNLDWIRLSAGSGVDAAFHMNHLGFDTLGSKHAVVEGPAGLSRFSVVGSDGMARWCGDLTGQPFSEWGSNQTFYSIDFTGLTEPGTYHLDVDGSVSGDFVIADRRLFSETFSSVLSYFKGSRADDADVWAVDAAVPFHGGGGTVDARGGWYDASGDISKYLTHLSYGNFTNPQQIPLVAWALAWVFDEGGDLLSSSGQATATREEALWGADYLVRVLDPAGYFYTNVFDGWSGALADREICAFEGQDGRKTRDWQSALREGGGMSIAALARVARWGVRGDFSAEEYLKGAEAAFAHLDAQGVQYADDGRENIIDDYTGLLAACELFATSGHAAYLDAARARATSLIARIDPSGLFIADGASRPFWHASDAGLPVVALARYVEVETEEAARAKAREAIRAHLTHLLAVTDEVPNPFGYARQRTGTGTEFFIPHTNETGYWWQGENARLGSLAAAAILGARAMGASADLHLRLLRYAGHQIDWILGSNPYDISFLRGHGRNNPPAYCSEKPQHGSLVGGISNGITGREADGSGIQWLSGAGGDECWMDWRWVEQWLPHAAWYMVAVTALGK